MIDIRFLYIMYTLQADERYIRDKAHHIYSMQWLNLQELYVEAVQDFCLQKAKIKYIV